MTLAEKDTERRLALARVALSLGPLFPLQRGDKRPLKNSNGCHDATTHWPTIASWVADGYNTGLHCTDVGVLDRDDRSGGDVRLASLEAVHGKLPLTPVQFTGGGGGQHYLFRLPKGLRWKSKIATGLDWKAGAGAYIVVPPSVVTRPYHWDESPEHVELAEIPAWLLKLAARFDAPTDIAPTGPVGESLLAVAFHLAGLVRLQRDEKILVRCPWSSLHSGREGTLDSSTVIFPPNARAPLGSFFCAHAHCAGRRAEQALAEIDSAHLEEAAYLVAEREAIRWESQGCPEQERAA